MNWIHMKRKARRSIGTAVETSHAVRPFFHTACPSYRWHGGLAAFQHEQQAEILV